MSVYTEGPACPKCGSTRTAPTERTVKGLKYVCYECGAGFYEGG